MKLGSRLEAAVPKDKIGDVKVMNIKYSQNFLTSEKVLNQIIKQLNLKETDTVYEIGTGKGHLTTKLAKISKQVTSIELDSHLFNLSSEKLKLNTRVTLIH